VQARHHRITFKHEVIEMSSPMSSSSDLSANTLYSLAPVRRDTRAWQVQVWVSFLLAASLCMTGLGYLPGQDIERAFMVMGYGFSLSAAFMLAKFVRDNEAGRNNKLGSDTPMWSLVVWTGFVLAMGLTGWGLWQMGINPTYKAYLGVSWLFLISSAFTLAKTLRDGHEVALAEARLQGARAMAQRDQ
jgi:hypothetical protein